MIAIIFLAWKFDRNQELHHQIFGGFWIKSKKTWLKLTMNFFFSDEYQKLQIFLMKFQSDTLEKNSQFGYQNLRLKFKDIYFKSFHQTTDWLGIDIDEIVALKCKSFRRDFAWFRNFKLFKKGIILSVFLVSCRVFFCYRPIFKKKSIKNSNHVFWFVVRSDRQKWIDCFLKIDPKIRKQINSAFWALNISKLKILKEYDWLLE